MTRQRIRGDYDSPFPECRVLSTVSPRALVRFDMPRDRALEWIEEVQQATDDHDGAGLVTLGLTMPESTYSRFASKVGELAVLIGEDVDGLVSAQVLLDPELEEDADAISVAVLLNSEQLVDAAQKAALALQVSEGQSHRWEFSVSEDGASMLVEQLVAACQGAEVPMDHVDLEGGGRP